VPKSLVTNLQGPKQVWVPKKNWFSFVGQLQSQRKALDSW
jgi:small nuclear ribonucleoprotein (snRNP)-like protein